MVVGLDVGKKKSVGCRLSADRSDEWNFRVNTTREDLSRLAKKVEGEVVIIETSTTGKAVARWLQEHEVEVHVVRADVLTAAVRQHKSDQLDARDLAGIGLLGCYSKTYLPTPAEEALRSLVRAMDSISKRTSTVKNQAKAILQRNLLPEPLGKLENPLVQRRYLALPLPPAEHQVLQRHLEEITRLKESYDELKLQVHRLVKDNPDVHLLLTLPRTGVYTAACVVAEVGDITRFSSAKKLAAYTGLVPRLKQSGDRSVNGRITKAGPHLLCHVLIQAAHRVVQESGQLRNQYIRLKQRTGGKKAIVAIARKLATIIWHMLTHQQPFKGHDPHTTQAKTWRLQHVATLHDNGHPDNARRLMNTDDVKRIHDTWKRGTSRIACP